MGRLKNDGLAAELQDHFGDGCRLELMFSGLGDRSASNMPSRLHLTDPKALRTGRPIRPRCPGSISTKGCCPLLATRNATLFSAMPPTERLLASAIRSNMLLPFTSVEAPP